MKKLLSLLTMACIAVAIQAQTIDDDKAALLEIYQALNGPEWVPPTGIDEFGWNEDNDVEDFVGVTVETGRVTKLELIGVENLSGEIPASIGKLDALTLLDLSNNIYLGGKFPDELFQLVQLNQLQLANTDITDIFDERFGKLKLLRTLKLDLNPGLTGGIPDAIGELKELTYLRLADNKNLTGTISPNISKAVKMETLQVERSGLTGTIPGSIGELQNLKYLNVNECNFTGIGILERMPATMLEAHKNRIPFGDLLPMKDFARKAAGGWYYRIIDQNPGLSVTQNSFTAEQGNEVILNIDILLPNHGGISFRWLKDGELVGTGKELVLNMNGTTMSGNYICEIATDPDLLNSSMCPNCDWKDYEYREKPYPAEYAVNTTQPIRVAVGINGINQTEAFDKIAIYGGAAKSSLIISAKNENCIGSEYQVINSTGKIVQSGIISSLEQEVTVQSGAGIYFVRITSNEDTTCQKVLIR